ncbi:MAG: LptF/LptG family permease [Pirellulaceae bacterium]
MNEIKRTVVLETFRVFLMTMAVALLLMTLGGGAREGLKRGLPPGIVLQTIPFIVPEMLRFVIPGCLLFAVCSAFGRMAASNEITALKSLGINPLRVVWPVLVLAYALSMFTFYLYDVCAVWARPNLQRLLSTSIDEIAYSFLRTNGSFSAGGMSILVKDVDEGTLVKPIVTIESDDDKPPITLVAERARLHCDTEAGILRIEADDGELEVPGKATFQFPDGFVHEIPLPEFDLQHEDDLSPAALGARVIPRQIDKEKWHLAQLEKRVQSKPPSETGEDSTIQQQIDYHRSRLFRLQAETQRRLSNGLGCFCFALVGVPVALGRRSADTMSVFFICFMPILLLYYPLLVMGENIARQGYFPHLSVWLADAVLLLVGAGLLYRVTRR